MTRLASGLRTALAALGMCALACSAAMACTAPGGIEAMRADTLRQVNAQRRSSGLAALAPEARLTAAAQDHACDMARRGRMGHTGSDGSKMGTRLRRAGYRFVLANENVGMGYPSPGQVVAGWMASAGHLANILADGTRDVGIGVALAGDGTPYWTMVSARAEPVAP